MARAVAEIAAPRNDPGGRTVNITVKFVEFPAVSTWLTRWNRPHVAIIRNGEQIFHDQPMFNRAEYHLDPEIVTLNTGDVVEVEAWWAAREIRNGEAQEPMKIGSVFG